MACCPLLWKGDGIVLENGVKGLFIPSNARKIEVLLIKDVAMSTIQEFGEKVIENLEKVIVGKRQSIELIVIGLLCQGHVLIEDVPGVGKTMLARSLARSLDCDFNRIQFTPDMLPSDVTGVSI